MRSKSIFNQTYSPRTSRSVAGFDSAVYSNLAIGSVEGKCRTLPALMAETATEDSVWRIVNLKHIDENQKNVFDAVAVLGAIDDEEAQAWALQQHGRFFDAIATDVQETNPNGLIRHLSKPELHMYQSPIRQADLAALQNTATGQTVLWDGVELRSHNGSMANLLHDMVKHDDHGELFDAMKGSEMASWLASMEVEAPGYDALIVQNSQLDRLMSRLSAAMARATESGVKIVNVTQSEPFKKNRTTQVAVVFEMSDGQSVSIIFHNPDNTPARLLPADTLISWKWLLNGRDVSAAIQPNQGEDVQLPVLAIRIMKIVNKNSERFKRTQAKKDENIQALADTLARIEQKTKDAAELDAEIAALQLELDKPVPTSELSTPSEPDPISDNSNIDTDVVDQDPSVNDVVQQEVAELADPTPSVDPEPLPEEQPADQGNLDDNDVASQAKVIAYLNSIIDGSADLNDGAAVEANLTAISEDLDEVTSPLFEQAAEAYAQWAISQAASV